jgi:hypothetical protein
MKRPFLYIIFSFFLTLGGQAQFFNNTLIKTRPLADFIAFNPNLVFEKPFNKHYSLEVDLMYRTRTWFSNGGEGNFGEFTPCQGFKLAGGFRVYAIKKKKAPFGFFLAAQLVVDYKSLKEIKMNDFHGEYKNTKDIQLLRYEIIPSLGFQFHITKRISSEFYLGPAIFLNSYRWYKIVNSLNPDEIGKTEYDKYPPGRMILPEFSWSIGYLLQYSQ